MSEKLGLTIKKEDDFSEWYNQLIIKSELIDFSEVSGCYILRPRSYFIWEQVKEFLDKEFKKLNVKNLYFPLFIPEKLLQKEASHVEGFSPEVAWVTEAGNSKLSERLAVRPTSETIMYDSYSKWVRSWKDLPLLYNQWNNVVRWEFKHPTPLIRFREFLWQEGHTCHADKKDADEEVRTILNIYRKVYEEILAVPMLVGMKSEKEKFAGADYTTSVETFLPSYKAVQAATSHHLGQNFAKAFDIKYLDKDGKEKYVYQNSWGCTVRSLGVVVIMHSDDKGLVLPPRVAEDQIVIIPIVFKDDKEKVKKISKEIFKSLKKYRVKLDDREGYSAGFKFNDWELKGIPIRIELGPKDVAKNQAVIVRRDTNKKEVIKIKNIPEKVKELLEDIQKNLFNQAKKFLNSNIVDVRDKKEFKQAIKDKKVVFAPWCGEVGCEEVIKDENEGVKSLNIPFNQKKISEKCFYCDTEAKYKAYFAKSY